MWPRTVQLHHKNVRITSIRPLHGSIGRACQQNVSRSIGLHSKGIVCWCGASLVGPLLRARVIQLHDKDVKISSGSSTEVPWESQPLLGQPNDGRNSAIWETTQVVAGTRRISIRFYTIHKHFSPPARWGSLDFIRNTFCFLFSFLPSSFFLLLPSSSFFFLRPSSPPAASDRNCELQSSVDTAGHQLRAPELNRELQISVGAAGPQPQVPDLSGHCRTSTASSRSQWTLPDINCELWSLTASSRSQWALPVLNPKFQISVVTAGPQPQVPDLSGHCRTSTASARSQWALLGFNRQALSSIAHVRENARKDAR